MKLSVIIPVYNEQATILRLLTKLLTIKAVGEIIIVDDHSQDETINQVHKIKDKRLKLIRHDHNQGKGAAIQTGLTQVTGDYVLIQDADLEYDPQDIPQMLQPIKEAKIEVVFGSRFMGLHSNMFFWHMVGNKLLNFLINILYDSILTDMETGYKLIPTKVFRSLNLQANDFGIEPEITCKLLRLKTTIIEVPISYIARTYEEGKKIGWQDWFKAVAVIIKCRWGKVK